IEYDECVFMVWNLFVCFAKIMLEKLFVHGRVLIATRRNFRRVYDLPERVVPESIRSAPPATANEAARWRVLLKLRQRRLVRLSRKDVTLVANFVQPVRVESVGQLYCLREDVPLF